MKYIESLFYIIFTGAVCLLLFKLLATYPLLADISAVAILWAGWELAKGLR